MSWLVSALILTAVFSKSRSPRLGRRRRIGGIVKVKAYVIVRIWNVAFHSTQTLAITEDQQLGEHSTFCVVNNSAGPRLTRKGVE